MRDRRPSLNRRASSSASAPSLADMARAERLNHARATTNAGIAVPTAVITAADGEECPAIITNPAKSAAAPAPK
ncbi:MAG: hypothetical protein IT354_08125 [Gemmatimonadaceae bacterium]|nr:hypothetical protein [Gemmatimonadaceae bacterium]